MTGHVDDDKLEKEAGHEKTITKVAGILLILIASVMSACIGVLNRSLRDIPYAVVLFYHSLFGIVATTIYLALALLVASRPLHFLGFGPIDNLLMFSATGLDAFSGMCQVIAFQSGSASFVSLVSFVNIIYAMLSDIFIFGEPVTVVQIVSAIGILIVCVAVGYEKIRLSQIKDIGKIKAKIIEATDLPKNILSSSR